MPGWRLAIMSRKEMVFRARSKYVNFNKNKKKKSISVWRQPVEAGKVLFAIWPGVFNTPPFCYQNSHGFYEP